MSTKHLHENILILGGTGLLGSSLVPVLDEMGYRTEVHGRQNAKEYCVDISDIESAFKLLDLVQPSVIVNLVGLTNVDQCEAQPNQAYCMNVRIVENVVGWMRQKKVDSHLVHISTDQVYDGRAVHAEGQVVLTNYYAFSKYAGELAAASVPSTILRTNFFGRSHCAKRESLTDWLFRSLSNGEPIQVFDDVMFSPLSMSTLSRMIEIVVQKKPIGVFNLGSHGGMSKADFAFAFAGELGCPSDAMMRCTTNQVTFLKTYRPKDMRMDCSKFENTLGVRLPFLREEIKQVAKEYSL